MQNETILYSDGPEMLVDEVEISVKAGDGGRGVVSFGKTETGPDGGNGGKGGDVYIEVGSDLTLLNQFQFKSKLAAEDGAEGEKSKRSGKRGDDLVVLLPVGSRLEDTETEEVFELDQVGEKRLFLKGGRGGIGNFDLRSARNPSPKQTKPPRPGAQRHLKISLSFIADYGLIGLPSSGKSSLLNELTNSEAKTGSYHFTTLSPNLGVLPNKKVMADIPGLIEGASTGKGLGIKFLKHIQKVSLLLHCVAADSVDPAGDYEVVRKELGEFDKKLLKKQEIILITKADLVDESELEKVSLKLKKFRKKMLATSIYDLEKIEGLMEVL